jgi:hypothetical protein
MILLLLLLLLSWRRRNGTTRDRLVWERTLLALCGVETGQQPQQVTVPHHPDFLFIIVHPYLLLGPHDRRNNAHLMDQMNTTYDE